MFVSNLLQQTLACVAFAVVLVVAVLLDDRLRRERNDLLVIGMNHGGSQHLMLIGDLVGLAVRFLQAGIAMHSFRRVVSRAIHRQQAIAIQKGVGFQSLSALQLSKNIVEQRPQRIRFERIEYLPHLRIARNLLDTKKSVHLGLSWVEIESTAVKVDRCFEVLTVSVAADTSLDRHDLAVEAFSNGIGDPMCAVADDVG